MNKSNIQCSSSNGAVYGLGMIGALVYYISTASNIPDGLFGIIKAVLWPAFVIYKVMESLSM